MLQTVTGTSREQPMPSLPSYNSSLSRKTQRLQQELDSLWTMRDVCAALGRTAMTIHNWRRQKGLPSLNVPGDYRPAVRYVPEDVRRWAIANDIGFQTVVKRYRSPKRAKAS